MKMFYQQNAVQTVLHPDGDTTLLRALDTPLAEHCSGARSQSLVLGCDQQGSPMNVMSANASRTGRYTPYGLETTLPSATGFTGQLKAWSLPGYFLGSGYRFFNTVLMRFHSPDSFSPFAAGGINAYMYCGGDPINRIDPSGHMDIFSIGRPRSPLHVGYDYSVHSLSAARHRLLVAPYPSQRPGAAVIASSSTNRVANVSAGSSTNTVANVSAGSPDYVMTTISAGPSSTSGTTGSTTFVRTSTRNYRSMDDSTRRHLAEPAVEQSFQDFIQTATPIRGMDGPQTQRLLFAIYKALRDKTEITAEDRSKFGADDFQKKNASVRVRRWTIAEMKRAGGNNVRLD
ncbi:RHS repeat-associated core domain-containing protein [Pseudomonas sp. NPDC012596]|uniref:RHS repeat-associated core domain-containing protein n=1 Tax=Pseudomonas sp. NPDC012596 TaxID=3364419 RepID=UPI0036939699